MGKSRRNRGSAAHHRRDPLAKPVKPPSDPELAALREAKILPIIRDLKSADPKARSAASSAISSIIQEERCRKLLLREQIVYIVLSQTLTDAALESRAAGWGILQVLAQEEDTDFCIHLYRLDILTAIEHASKAITDKLSPQSGKLPKAEQPLILSIAASIVSLCTALAEAQDDILEAIANNAAINTLLFGLTTAKPDVAPGIENLRSDTLACLMVLSEDNPKLAGIITTQKHSDVYQALQVLKGEVSGDGILACAILQNLSTSLEEDSSIDREIPDVSALISTLSKAIAGITPGSQKSAEDNWSNPVQYQQLALEVLASIGTSLTSTQESDPRGGPKQNGHAAAEDADMELDEVDKAGEAMGEVDLEKDDANSEVDEDEDDDDDEMDDDELQADMDMVTGVDDDDEPKQGIDDLPVLKSLLQQAVPALIRVASIQVTDEESVRFQNLALSALNNLSWSLSLFDFSDQHNSGIQNAWTPTGQLIWRGVVTPTLSSDTADVTLAAQITGLAWALARSLRSETPLQPDEHRKFISLYQATRGTAVPTKEDEDPFQGLGVKCIGVLGQLALDPAPAALNREIGTFLVTTLASLPETPVADAVEALGQLFDIYGDEEAACDKEVFWKDNFLKHLEDVLPKAKNMVKAVDKRSHAELRTRAEEAAMNLQRFAAYKKKHKP